jgi:hypothetical protein
MHRSRDLDLDRTPQPNADDLRHDLELDTLLDVMARGDTYLRPLVEHALLSSLADPDEIRYRQDCLEDCLREPDVVRELYDLSVDAVDSRRQAQVLFFRDSPEALLSKSVRILELLADVLARLRKIADEHASDFRSQAFGRFFSMLREELDDEYLESVRGHLRELRFVHGALISAELGGGNRGTRFVLRKPRPRNILQRITPGGPPSYSFTLPPRDEHGAQALGELRDRGTRLVAAALAQSTDHILAFAGMLRAELGFYVGCLNLHEQLASRGLATCFPEPAVASGTLSARGLYDAALTFHTDAEMVGNDVDADGKALLVVTGANQGGKSTFLRSVGIAQLMLQAGMFVPAEAFRADLCTGVFTHYKREEDATMTHGKLDEELARMREIVDQMKPRALLLSNESFASTNELEGSEIARHVIHAFVDAGVKVVLVTHLHDLAQGLYRERFEHALFLRAERQPNGHRTFRIVPGEPLPTAHGSDSYERIFGVPLTEAATTESV